MDYLRKNWPVITGWALISFALQKATHSEWIPLVIMAGLCLVMGERRR